MTEVLLVDDHTMFREGINRIVREESDISIKDEAATAREAFEKMQRNDYDVVLLDIRLPGRDGIDVLKQLKEVKPKIPVLMLTMYDEDVYALRALQSGASGYVTKHQAAIELIEAIRKVKQGNKYLSPNLAQKLGQRLNGKFYRPLHENLSDREFEIMSLLVTGKSLKEIAAELNLSPNTVSTYRQRILKKMKMKNVVELIYYALKEKLV